MQVLNPSGRLLSVQEKGGWVEYRLCSRRPGRGRRRGGSPTETLPPTFWPLAPQMAYQAVEQSAALGALESTLEEQQSR